MSNAICGYTTSDGFVCEKPNGHDGWHAHSFRRLADAYHAPGPGTTEDRLRAERDALRAERDRLTVERDEAVAAIGNTVCVECAINEQARKCAERERDVAVGERESFRLVDEVRTEQLREARAEVERLRAALRPFAEFAFGKKWVGWMLMENGDVTVLCGYGENSKPTGVNVNYSDFERARAALSSYPRRDTDNKETDR